MTKLCCSQDSKDHSQTGIKCDYCVGKTERVEGFCRLSLDFVRPKQPPDLNQVPSQDLHFFFCRMNRVGLEASYDR